MRARPRSPIRPLPALARLRRVVVVAALAMACGGGVPQEIPGGKALSPRELEIYARRSLLDARALRDEGRLESAARVAARGLELEPDNAELQRLRAELLEALGRSDEARAHRHIADLLDPPPPPPPDQPLDVDSKDVVVALLPPESDPSAGSRVPQSWPDDPVAATLQSRAAVRLPAAEVRLVGREEPATVASGREWLARDARRGALSLRVDRAFCARSLKDGEFAVAWLRVSVAEPGRAPATTRQVRTVLNRPADPEHCREDAMARAFEDALALEEVRAVLESPGPHPVGTWSTASIRSLFPSLGRRIVAEIDSGRQRLRLGDLDTALAHFREASAIDPDDLDTRAFVLDAEDSIAMADQLAPVSMHNGKAPPSGGARAAYPAGAVDTGLLPPGERRRLEAQLAEEQRRREELLAALSVIQGDDAPPDAEILASLRPAEIGNPDAIGPRLARSHSPPDAPLRTGVLYAPDGAVIARYYFAGQADRPVLREDDTSGDGRPDRWIVYESGARRYVYEDRQGNGHPDLALTFARGGPLERLEIDSNGDGRPERVFRYSDGRLLTEDRDSNGDGRPDLFEHFDGSGALTLREQDVNGDGNVDVRTAYRDGRIVSREILDPDAVTEIR